MMCTRIVRNRQKRKTTQQSVPVGIREGNRRGLQSVPPMNRTCTEFFFRLASKIIGFICSSETHIPTCFAPGRRRLPPPPPTLQINGNIDTRVLQPRSHFSGDWGVSVSVSSPRLQQRRRFQR